MKKFFRGAAILLVLTLTLSGCGSAKKNAGDSPEETFTQNQVNPDNAENPGNAGNPSGQDNPGGQEKQSGSGDPSAQGKPDSQPAKTGSNAQAPQSQSGSQPTQNSAAKPAGNSGQFTMPDMTGEVVSVTGNEIAIKVIKMPEKNGNQADNSKSAPTDGQAAPEKPSQDGQPPQRNIEYTGETKTIKISDNVTVTKMSMGDNGPQTQDIKIGDIKAGDILQIYYSDKENQTISKIILGMGMGMRPQKQSTN